MALKGMYISSNVGYERRNRIPHCLAAITRDCIFTTLCPALAFSAELCPSTYTDLAVMGVLGLAGVTTSQVQAYLSVTVGDKPPVGMELLVRTVCQLLPGYVYAFNTPPQYPRRLLHKLLPALKELCFERNLATIRHICGPLVNNVVDLNMFMAARTLYVRGQHLWHSHINNLRLQRRVAKSPHAKRFRHRYHDFQADQINATSSMKDVFVPVQPDPLFAYYVDAGLLTVSFDTPDKAPNIDFCYQFPGHSVYRTVGFSFPTQHMISDFRLFSFVKISLTMLTKAASLFDNHLTVLRSGYSTLWIHTLKSLAARCPTPTRLKTHFRVSGPA